MNVVTSMQFSEFFEALYGYGPFPWQAELAGRVAEAQPGDACWPQALALPTAAGKTACIDMAIFALAGQSDRPPEQRTAPRRIFFVVDRRVIVDETFARAQKLAEKLRDARRGADGILKDVADRLCSLAQGDDEDDPLACFQLRGGMYRDDAWARTPLQPTVVVTTVDQFGSRLLFRGYGSSAGMRPVHAGLAANDCLILLDEAHCANPFRQTVSSVQRYREWASQPGNIGSVPFHLTLISATPPPDIPDEERFTAGDGDLEHPVLGRRINASKPAKLVVARNARGDNALERLAQQIGDEAVKLVSEERKAIGVMVNRVATARRVYEHLRRGDLDRDVTLLTGRMRAIDRDDVVRGLESLKTSAYREERTRFIVATQTLEVGADLDFDGLVTECASLDALRQRFGRLNRDGRSIDARAAIVIRADQTNPNSKTADDPVYGTSLAETWQWLNERANQDEIDFGFAAMDSILPDEPELEQLCQQAADAPVMLPAHVDAWAQTSPVPAPDPDPAIFLHGPNRGAPEVQVCWRADLSTADMSDAERAIGIVSLCPPASPECISVPIQVLRRWLSREETGNELTDLEGVLAEDSETRERRTNRSALCWRGPEESELVTNPSNVRPGDTVVIPAEMGGWDVFGHIPTDPDGGQVIDVGDRAHLQSKAKAVLRIRPQIVESWPKVTAQAFFEKIAKKSQSAEDWDELEAQIPENLDKLAAEITEMEDTSQRRQWKWLKESAEALVREYQRGRRPKMTFYPETQEDDDGVYGFVLQGSQRVKEYLGSASTLTSEDDSYSATVRVTMDDHLLGVERWARSFGDGHGALAIGDNLTVPTENFRTHARNAALAASPSPEGRSTADFMAAFGCDSVESVDRKGQIQDTALRTMSGTGHQNFLKTMRDLAEKADREKLRQCLFSGWQRKDPQLSLRWDPEDDRRYALRWKNPSDDRVHVKGEKSGAPTEWGANRLAFEALPLFPVMPVLRGVQTTGFSGTRSRDTFWTWPVWDVPVCLDTVRSLLALSELQRQPIDHERLEAMGIRQVFRSRRVTIDQYRTFTPSAPL